MNTATKWFTASSSKPQPRLAGLKEGQDLTVIIPVVVPRTTPKRGYDTRRSRAMGTDLPLGLSRSEWHASVTYDDGTTEVIEHKIRYNPDDGYMMIAKFMAYHITEYRTFSAEMFTAIAASGFGNLSTKLEKGSHGKAD